MSVVSSFALGLGDALQWAGLIASPLLLTPLLALVAPRLVEGPGLRVANLVDSTNRALMTAGAWLGLFMAVAMLANVMMRYVFGIGFGWARDLWIYAFAGVFMLASAGALQDNGHVRVDVIFSRFTRRQRAMVDMAGAYLFLFPLMILILWTYAPELGRAWGSANGRLELARETDGLPLRFLFKTLVPVFAAAMIAQGWSNSLRAALVLAGREHVPAPALSDNTEPHSMIAENLHILMFVAAFAALLMGYHVALTLGGVALAFAGLGIAFDIFEPRSLIFWPGRILGNMSNQVLAAIPLFVLMGVLLEKSRVAEDLLDAMGRIMGGIRGGLGYSIVLVGALLAASTGIVGATVVTMTLIALPSMLSQGYDKRISSGVIAASGTLGQIIPPSIVLIVLADAVSNANAQARSEAGLPPSPVSAGDLFSGALLPGLILVGLYLGYIALLTIIRPNLMPARQGDEDPASAPSTARTVFAFGAPLMLVLAVLGSILGGFTSPTEAASVGAIGALLLSGARVRIDAEKPGWTYTASLAGAGALLLLIALVWVIKLGLIPGLTPEDPPSAFFTGSPVGMLFAIIVSTLIPIGAVGAIIALSGVDRLTGSLRGSAEITAMVFLILICAALFSIVFRELGGDEFVEHLLTQAPGGLWGALAFTLLAIFIPWILPDFLEIVFIVTPLVAPPLIAMGADPVWLGVLFAINLQTSFLTPPFGFALFYLKGAAPPEIDTPDIWRGALPFIVLQLIGLGLVLTFPGLTGR